jgi:hypothetical protein
VNSTEATPAVGGRQVGHLLAGRYRLAMSKGGDDVADVWHALDESTQQVVTLEILRDPGNDAARQRFLAEARRMAAIERPSVMRVASILDEGADIFIVFEHLIPLPVVLTGLTAVARDTRPATKAAEERAAVPPSTLAAVAGPTRTAAAPEAAPDVATPPTIVEPSVPEPSAHEPSAHEPSAPQLAMVTARPPEPPQDVTLPLGAARPDMSGPTALGTRLADEGRALLRDVGMDTVVADIRALFSDARARSARRFDTSLVTSLVARATAVAARVAARVGRLTSPAPNTRVASAGAAEPAKTGAPHAGASLPKLALPKLALPRLALPGVALPKLAVPRIRSLGTGGTALIARARGNRVVLAGGALIVLAVVVVASPLDDAIGSALRGRPAPSPTVAPRAALVPAPFVLPPLSAYGAAFESQGPYPTTTPNQTVEWVVALRNTGSAGWYRGIDGAQAALALPDGAGVAVQSTDYVAPGQVGWFVVRFKARAELGTYTVQLLPRIDGRGPLPELGIFTVVTVSKNP